VRRINWIVIAIFAVQLSATAHAYDAAGNGEWMTMGVPRQVHQGSQGDFYLTGNAMAKCANVTPNYIRINMSDSHWKEMYALILFAAAQGLSIECVIDSGCGGTQVWVTYCRTLLQQ
jgi:hypothetical protein